MSKKHNRHGHRSNLRLAVLLALLVGLLLLFFQRDAVYDAWRLRGYAPPAEISNLADQDKMTDQGRHLFYINHPQLINDAATFRSYCTVAEQTIILGCYHGPQTGIYVYQVQDSRLSGIQQVTAAHEMLHAAYDRLSPSERSRIDGLLNDYYQNSLTDERIKSTIDAYKKSEPKDIVNEMHSIFGTEIANLPQPLEEYYKQYFSDRTAVIGYSTSYENEFTSRQAQADALKQRIDAEDAALQQQRAAIDAEKSRMDTLRSSGNIREFNAAVDGFNAMVDEYNAKVAVYKRDVETYNAKLGELQALYAAIDATKAQATKTQ